MVLYCRLLLTVKSEQYDFYVALETGEWWSGDGGFLVG